MAGCGTLVQVVDTRDAPVSGAQVQLVDARFNSPIVITDSDGYVRIKDSFLWRPLFSSMPAWVSVTTAAGRWAFDYPPPSVLRLDERHREKPDTDYHLEASQQAAAAGDRPQAGDRG